MPELYSLMPSILQINVRYLPLGQEIITLEQYSALNPEILATGAGTQLAKTLTSMFVKYSTYTSLIKAKNILYIAKRTSIPVPRLYTAYTYGPLDRDVNDFRSVYDTYIFVEFIEGKDLGKS
jgi:hypothetical protein